MTLSTIVLQAAMARDLDAVDVRVLVVASDVLDFVEYRSLKVAGLALVVRAHPGRVCRAMERLVAAGFLDRHAPASPQELSTYRLPFSQRRTGTAGLPRRARCAGPIASDNAAAK